MRGEEEGRRRKEGCGLRGVRKGDRRYCRGGGNVEEEGRLSTDEGYRGVESLR